MIGIAHIQKQLQELRARITQVPIGQPMNGEQLNRLHMPLTKFQAVALIDILEQLCEDLHERRTATKRS